MIGQMLWNSPISEERFEEMARRLDLQPGQRVLDVGCGTGEMLTRLAENYKILGMGVETSINLIAKARSRSAERLVDGPIQWVVGDASRWDPQETFDVVMCLGATHAFGSGQVALRNAIQAMRRWVKPGGLLLIGEAIMRRKAPPEYREIIQRFPPDSMTHSSNVKNFLGEGLSVVSSWTSTETEWDAFEFMHQEIAETSARDHPNDIQAQEKLEHRRMWIDGYEKWGRTTLGFVVYLARTPAPGS